MRLRPPRPLAAAAVALWTTASAGAFAAAPSGGNPLGTPEEDAAELLATGLYASAPVQAELASVRQQWRASAAPSDVRSYASLEQAVRNLGFAAAVGAIGLDPTRPALLRTGVEAHTLFGVRIPGTAVAINNPDTIYREATLDGASRYLLVGRRAAVVPVDVNFSILDATSTTIANIGNDDLVVAPDGTFAVTIDATPANGRPDHLQIPAGASTLLKRDTLDDWATQRPDALILIRLSGPAAGPVPTAAALEAAAVAGEKTNLAAVLSVEKLLQAEPVNFLAQPVVRTGGGFLSTQANSVGRFALTDDDAYVLTLRLGGAKYMTFPVNDFWQVNADYHHHTSSLNNAQALPNPDGTYTFVLSVKDPGVYNWIDPNGQHDLVTQLRWQGLATTPPAGGGPAIVSQALVPLSALAGSLPPGTVFVTPAQRLEQQQERARSIAWRDSTG